MKNVLVGLAFALICSFQLFASNPDAPSEFGTSEEIRAWVESRTGFGVPSFFETDVAGTKVFAGWVDPFSGRSADYVYAYSFSAKDQKWRLLDASFVDKQGPLSFVYLDSNSEELIYVNRKGRKFKKISVAKTP